MRDPLALITRCHDLAIRLTVDGGRLVVDAPQGAMTPALTAELRDAKEALINELNARADDTLVEPRPGAPLPASFGQERLWIQERWAPGTATWLISSVIILAPEVDDGLLEQAVVRLVGRHAALRTILVEDGGRLWQRILPAASPPMHREAPACLAMARAAERSEAARPLDPARDLPFRVCLTATHFRPHPERPGMRCYRTGDRGRWNEAGRLVVCGRLDQQIKLRGFRIEPGDIESALTRLPAVAQAAVVLQEDPGGRGLAAFAVAAGTATPELAVLKPDLGRTLPDYMMPATLTWLPALPMTPNGKIDRKALLHHHVAPPVRCATRPRSGAESRIAAVFAEFLQRAQVGREDNFFELGGHSLLAVRVVDRLARDGVHLSPGDLVAQDVAQLAAHHGRLQQEGVS